MTKIRTTKKTAKVTDSERLTIAVFVLLTTFLAVVLPIIGIVLACTTGNALPELIVMVIWGAAEAFQIAVLYCTYDIPIRTIQRKIKAIKKELDSFKNKEEE